MKRGRNTPTTVTAAAPLRPHHPTHTQPIAPPLLPTMQEVEFSVPVELVAEFVARVPVVLIAFFGTTGAVAGWAFNAYGIFSTAPRSTACLTRRRGSPTRRRSGVRAA